MFLNNREMLFRLRHKYESIDFTTAIRIAIFSTTGMAKIALCVTCLNGYLGWIGVRSWNITI